MAAAEEQLLRMADIGEINQFLKAEMPKWPAERLQASRLNPKPAPTLSHDTSWRNNALPTEQN